MFSGSPKSIVVALITFEVVTLIAIGGLIFIVHDAYNTLEEVKQEAVEQTKILKATKKRMYSLNEITKEPQYFVGGVAEGP